MQPVANSFSLREWCEHRRISLPMFYKLDEKGKAPRTYYVGDRRMISPQADAEWLRQREAESPPPPRPRGRQASKSKAA